MNFLLAMLAYKIARQLRGLLHHKVISKLILAGLLNCTILHLLLLDHLGTFIEGSCKVILGRPVEEIETWRFLLRLQLTIKLDTQGFIIERDCQSITKLLLNKNIKPPWRIAKIIQNCPRLINSSTPIFYVPQSCNNVAHYLASLAAMEQIGHPMNSDSIDDVIKLSLCLMNWALALY